MDILHAASQLFPGTSWIVYVSPDGTRVLVQAQDNAPRVIPPSLQMLDAYVAVHPDPIVPTLEDRVSALEVAVAALQPKPVVST